MPSSCNIILKYDSWTSFSKKKNLTYVTLREDVFSLFTLNFNYLNEKKTVEE